MDELTAALRYLYDTNNPPNADQQYAPVEQMRAAEEAAAHALARLEPLVGFDLFCAAEEAQTAYGASCEVYGFDRGFRAGARLVLALLRSGQLDTIPA